VAEPQVVGIAGGTCSGKTRLAEALRNALGSDRCAVLTMDSYYDVPEHTGKAGFGHANFDHPTAIDFLLIEDHLNALLAGKPVAVPRYDRKTNSRVGSNLIVPTDVILIEGLFVLWHGRLRSRLTKKVFLDVDAEVRVVWRLLRDVGEYGTSIAEAVDYYLEVARPMYAQFVAPTMIWADLILEGPMPISDQVTAVLGLLGTPWLGTPVSTSRTGNDNRQHSG